MILDSKMLHVHFFFLTIHIPDTSFPIGGLNQQVIVFQILVDYNGISGKNLKNILKSFCKS
jgi:hypothetical protein